MHLAIIGYRETQVRFRNPQHLFINNENFGFNNAEASSKTKSLADLKWFNA